LFWNRIWILVIIFNHISDIILPHHSLVVSRDIQHLQVLRIIIRLERPNVTGGQYWATGATENKKNDHQPN
jgi:hypothetical protein